MGLKIWPRYLRLRLFRTGLAAGCNPVFEQDVSRLAVEVGAEADQPLEAGETPEVIDRLAFSEYAMTVQQAGVSVSHSVAGDSGTVGGDSPQSPSG